MNLDDAMSPDYVKPDGGWMAEGHTTADGAIAG